MPIYFNSSPVNFPFQFDSIGNNWDQEPTLRPDGFPLYHYLQTQEGCGILTIDGRDYTIEENQGVLLAPGVSHAYRSASGKWITLFATFSGSMSPYFSTLFGSSHLLFFEAEKAAILRKLIDQAVLHHQETPVNPQLLSLECYQVLLQFTVVFKPTLPGSRPGKNISGRFLLLYIPGIWRISLPKRSARKFLSHRSTCHDFFPDIWDVLSMNI